MTDVSRRQAIIGAAALASAPAFAQSPAPADDAPAGAPKLVRVPRGAVLFVDALSPDASRDIVTFRSAEDVARRGVETAMMSDAATTLRLFFANGGAVAHVLPVADGAPPDTLDKRLQAAEAMGDLDFVAAPFAARLSGEAAGVVYRPLLAFARSRRAMLLVDPPAEAKSGAEIGRWATALDVDDRDAAAYAPRLKLKDTAVAASSSGPVAGLLSARGAAQGVWRPVTGAGAALVGVEGWGPVSQDAAAAISGRSINLVRPLDGALVLWGARTLSTDPEWRFLPVRRLALEIEKSLLAGLAWATFEPNDAALWRDVQRVVDDFLMAYWRDGAFVGKTPSEAFFVRCDRTTTTATDVAEGLFRILIGFAPTKPAEFTYLSVAAAAGR